METNKFENWEPKSYWVYHENGGRTLMGCHCKTPYDDCGCDDCQERHGYRAWYNRKEQCFYQEKNGIIEITGRVSSEGIIYKESQLV